VFLDRSFLDGEHLYRPLCWFPGDMIAVRNNVMDSSRGTISRGYVWCFGLEIGWLHHHSM